MSDEKQDTETAPAREWPVVINLKHPVENGSERITSLTFQRGKLGHLKGVKLDELVGDHLITVAARMCGQPPRVIEALDPDDSEEVVPVVLDFFARCLGGGKKP